MSMPWNRSEDAEARALFKKTIQDIQPDVQFVKPFFVPEQIVYQSKYYGFKRFLPDIFKEATDEQAYKLYQNS